MKNLKAVLTLAEPKTLIATLLPAIASLTYILKEGYKINFFFTGLALLSLILMQITANIFNDYMDAKKGLDQKHNTNLQEKALFRYDISLLFIKRTWQITTILATSIGIFLSFTVTNWFSFTSLLILVLGMVAFIVIFSYSSGPLPISYTPFGELISGFTMGFLIPCLILVVNYKMPTIAFFVYCLPICVMIALLLFTNNECDRIKDRKNKRKTLAIILNKPLRIMFRLLISGYIFIWMFINSHNFLSYLFLFLYSVISFLSISLPKSANTKEKNMKIVSILMLILLLYYISLH